MVKVGTGQVSCECIISFYSWRTWGSKLNICPKITQLIYWIQTWIQLFLPPVSPVSHRVPPRINIIRGNLTGTNWNKSSYLFIGRTHKMQGGETISFEIRPGNAAYHKLKWGCLGLHPERWVCRWRETTESQMQWSGPKAVWWSNLEPLLKKDNGQSWPHGSIGWSITPGTKTLRVCSPVRVPLGGNQSMFFSNINISQCLSISVSHQ